MIGVQLEERGMCRYQCHRSRFTGPDDVGRIVWLLGLHIREVTSYYKIWLFGRVVTNLRMGKGAFQERIQEAEGPGAHAVGSDVECIVHCLFKGSTAISPACGFLIFCFSGRLFSDLPGFLDLAVFLGCVGCSATTTVRTAIRFEQLL